MPAVSLPREKAAEMHKAWPKFIGPHGSWDNTATRYADRRETGSHNHRFCIGSGYHRTSDERQEQHVHEDRNILRLEKWDGYGGEGQPDGFDKDEEAWLDVWNRAAQGSEVCRAALYYLRCVESPEYEFIRQYCTERR